MQTHPINVQDGTPLNAELVRYLTALDEVMSNQPLLTQDEDRLTTWLPEIVRRVTPPAGLGNVISRILLDAVGRSETIGPGGGPATLQMTIFITLALLRQMAAGEDPQKLLQGLQEDVRCLQELIQVETRWPILSELHELLAKTALCDFERDLVNTAIDLAGLEGRIFVETSSGPRSLVELSQDHSFQLSPVPEVVDPSDSWSGSNVRIGVIDGMIERVSEIHALLEAASANVEPVVLLCRGYSEEVIATLGLNRKRGTLNVIPIIVPFDAESANSLKDVAVILECDIVTALKGQLISSMTWDEMTIVNEVQWTSGVLTIRSTEHSQGLDTHIEQLMKRRADLPPDGRRDILDNRIRSLTTFGVGIRVGGENAIQHTQSIDVLLRSVRAIISYGLVDVDAVLKQSDSSLCRHALEKIDFFGSKPAISLAAVIKYSMEATTSIANTGAAILLDR